MLLAFYASAVMAVVLFGLGTLLSDLSQAVRLIIVVPAGVLVFNVVLLALWHAAGRPQGAEAMVTAFVVARLSRGRG